MKKKIVLLLFGLLLISIWSACFLNAGMADDKTAFMGLVFTPLSAYFLQREYDFKLSVWDKWAVAILPVLYVFALYFTLFDLNYFKMHTYSFPAFYQLFFYLHIINPVTIAFLVLLLALSWLKDLTNPRNIFIFGFIAVFYSYYFMFEWKSKWFWGSQVNFDTEVNSAADVQKQRDSTFNTNVNLTSFSFINSSLDTVNLVDNSGKYVLLETWAETCPPCLKAIKELPDFYKSMENKMSVYYVYEHRKASVRRNFDKIFGFREIEDKSKMLIDIEQELYLTLNMDGYPYFLLFDPKGDLVYHIRGYGDKDLIATRISEHVK
jgi:thioredoxin-related protein